MAQRTDRLESPTPRCFGTRGSIDDDGSADAASGARQHPLLGAFDFRIDEGHTEFPQLLIHIFNRLAVDIEMIPEPLGGEVAGLLRVGGGSDGIQCDGSQFLGKSGHRRGCLIQLPDLVSHGL